VNPQQLTTVQAVDNAFNFILGISVIMLLLITGLMIYFVIRYSRKRCPVPLSQKDHNLWLEIVWTTIPTILVMAMFWFGWEGFLTLQRIPDDAIQVDATARMWSWKFIYDSGKSSDKLYVPVGTPVKVKLESLDVLHAFYAPAFRVKRDIVPGMTTWVWFKAEETGSYNLFCAEYCGVGHADMITTIEAIPLSEFNQWVTFDQPPVVSGKILLGQYGCLGCHSLDGSESVGPTLQKIAGRLTRVERDGERLELSIDRDYLRRSIVDPKAEIVEGFPPIMPPFAGVIPESDLERILDFLLGGEMTAPVDGEKIAKDQGCLGCHSTDGSERVGPSFKAIFGRITEIEGGGEITVDAAYLLRSITHPEAEIVDDFPPIMPAYDQLTDAELNALVDYLKGLK
jgi:cytochrome c oxidase subunit 2